MLSRRRELASNKLQKILRKKAVRKQITRFALVAANILVLVGVTWFVISEASVDTAAVPKVHFQESVAALSPVDKLTASDVAVNVARATNLAEVKAVTNQAQSDKVAVLMSASDTDIAAKPQIVDTQLKSWRDIKEYVVVAGDTVSSVAQKFGVSSDSIRWSNNITGNNVNAGTKLYIPPGEGIAYLVASGDTPSSLATKFHASADSITLDNDAEQGGLVVGRRIYIANGQIIATVTPRTYSYSVSSFTPQYGSNGYDWGWCTYYAAARSGAPGNWGNANTWAYYARLSGWRVSSAPTAGAIFQTPSGWAGHVGIIEEVSEDGGMIKYSDMNGLAGFGQVGYSGWVPASTFPNYISRS